MNSFSRKADQPHTHNSISENSELIVSRKIIIKKRFDYFFGGRSRRTNEPEFVRITPKLFGWTRAFQSIIEEFNLILSLFWFRNVGRKITGDFFFAGVV